MLGSTLAISQRSSDYQFFDPLVDIKAIIGQRYVEEPDLEESVLRLYGPSDDHEGGAR